MSDTIPIKLCEMALETKENVIIGLMEDNKRLKEQVKSLEELAEENREEYEKLYDKNARLIQAIKKLVP